MQINIYSQDGTLKATVSSSSGDQCVKELQGDSTLSLSFEYYAYVALEVNDYVDFCGDRYWLLSQYHPAEKSSVSWKYDVTFYGIESLIKRYLVLEHTDGDANPVFSLTAPALQHVNMIVECLNNATGTEMWTVGEVVSTGNITIDYTGKYCDEGLRELAENAETEYWFDGTAVNLCKCERGERLNLAYGDGLISLERDVADGVKFYTRLYPIGSSRNIDSERYGHSRLQLPNGAKYVDLEVEKYGVVDHYEQEAFSGIYPRYTGTISEVRVESRTDDEGTKFKVYFFKDAGLPFDPNDYLLPNEKMRVSFQSGELHGLGETDDHYFEVDYNSETSEFEIINIWTDGEQLPYGNLVPAVGDTFIPWNIGMPDEYYDLAELEFQEAVANYNQNHFKDISIYRGTTDHVWIESDENTGKEEVELFIGRRVRLVSSQYFPVNGYRDSRITKITRRVDLPSLMDIEISDVVTKGGQERINDSIKSVREYAKSIEGTLPDLVKTGDDKKFTDSNVLTALRSAREFISRLHDDSIHGYITMLKGLQIGANFVPDILGEGGVFRMREDGKVELVTDILYTRMQAYFDSVVIREFRHESGNRIKSPAQGFNASRVEYIRVVSGVETIVEDASEADFFRCYWRVDDGEKKAENQFIIGDLAFCEHSDVVNGSLVTKRYWRVVTGRNSGNTTTADGEAWIDLSNDRNASGNPVMTTITYEGQGGTTQTKSVLSFENGSDVPEAHDDICMLGCVTDNTRQGAIIEYASGTDTPSYQIYQSIGSDATNPYVLNGKNQITIGYNTATGKADVKVYGDAYIGDPNGSTFIKYEQENPNTHAPKLSIKAEIEAQSTIGNQSLPDYIKDNQNNYDDTEVQQAISNLSDVTDNLQAQIDGQIESWFYNGTPGDSVLPESEWKAIDIAAGNNNERLRHLGDMYYDNETGYAYRYSNSGTESNPVFYWNTISDSAVVKALADAAAALGLADTKAKIFSTASGVLPTPPYKVNDIWVNATGTWGSGANAVTWENEILKCTNAKTANQQASINDWAKASKYTDDSAFNGYINAFLNGSGAAGDSATAAAIQKAIASALGSGAVVAGGLLLTSLIGMRQNVGTTENPVYETWGGISGQYDNWSGATHAKGHGIAAWYGGAMVDKEDVETLPASYAKSLFRFDGSGYLAGGNITWDSQGRVAIKDITTLIGNNNSNVLNELTTFNNAFHFTTSQGSSTILSISPQAGFTSLSILDPEDNTLKPVATQEWVNGNYITKTFFNRILKVHYKKNGVDNILGPNDDFPAGATDKCLESVFSFWTNYALTALGQGQDGSVSYTTLAQLNDVTLTNPTANQILVYDGTHWRNQNQQSVYELPVATTTTLGGIMLGYAASGKNYAIQLDANGKAYVNVPWSDTTYTLPTASADTLGGVKIGSTLAIASGVLNLPTTGVIAGTYKRVTVDAYGRVTSGDNTDIDTNTWRNIYVGGTSKVGTGIDTKAINFKAGSNVAISYVAAGTGSGQSGNANYFDVVISATDTTYSAATQSVAGLMSAADKKKLDGVAEGANNYSLPLAASGTRGGVKVGYSETNSGTSTDRNYAVQLSSEKMYVNVPWVNTWRGIQNNLTSQSTTDSLSAYQGYLLANGSARDNSKLPLTGGTLTGTLTTRDVVVQSNYSLKIGNIYLTYDSTNNAIRVSANADGTGVANLYAIGGISALGQSNDGQAGVGDVTWALLADNTDNRQIALSHLSTGLTTLTGYTTSGKNYAVQKDANNHLYVNVPWEAGSGTVTSIKVGTTTYNPSSGVVSLPAYPKTLPASDVYSWAKAENKPVYTYSEVGAASSTHTHATNIATSSGTNQITLAFGSKYAITAGGTSYVFTMPSNPNTNTTYKFTIGSTTKGDATNGVDLGTLKSETAVASGTTLSLVTTGEKAIWNAKSNLAIGTTATTAAAGNHTHTLSIAADSGTNQFALAHNTKYKLTAGGSSLIFTTPADSNSWRNIYTGGTSQIGTGTNTKAMNFVGVNGIAVSFLAAGTGTGQSGNANYFSIKLDGSHTHATSIAADSGTNQLTLAFGTKYKLTAGGTSYIFTMPANPNTDHYDWSDITNKPLTLTKNTTGFSISGGITSKTLTVSESYTLGAACAKGVTDNSSNADVTSSDTNLITGRTLYYQLAKKGYTTNTGTVTSVAAGTGLTGGTITTSGTISINSTYQTYISHGETAYGWGNHANANYMVKGSFDAVDNEYDGWGELSGSSYTPLLRLKTARVSDDYGCAYFAYKNYGTKDTRVSMQVDGYFYQNEGQYRVLDTSDATGLSVNYANSANFASSSNYATYAANLYANYVNGDTSWSWNPLNQTQYYTWGQQFKNANLSTDTGDMRLYIAANTTAGGLGLWLNIDGGINALTSLYAGEFVQVGNIKMVYDSTNNAIKVIKADGTAANFYATGSISALGAGQESGGGGNYLPLSGGSLSGTLSIKPYSLTDNAYNEGIRLHPYNNWCSLVLCGSENTGDSGTSENTWGVFNNNGNFHINKNGSKRISSTLLSNVSGKWIFGSDTLVHERAEVTIYNDRYPNMLLKNTGDDECSIYFENKNNANKWAIGVGPWFGTVGNGFGIGDYGASLGLCFYINTNGTCIATHGFSNQSDVRFKTKVSDIDLSVEQIAKMPTILYRWNDREDARIYAGSIAQNWESVLPQVVDVGTDPRQFHSLQYGVAALISAITVARKVMTHEEKIALLETRVSALEKENGELIKEIEQLKIA